MDQLSAALGGGASSLLSPNQRLVLGILLLLCVDIIWVASSELTEYIFNDEKFDKPFFSTYVKTSMFLFFLLGFVFWSPWGEICSKNNAHNYMLVGSSDNQESTDSDSAAEGIDAQGSNQIEDEEEDELEIDNNANEPIMSPPSYIPIHFERDQTNNTTTGSESDTESIQHRSVRFSKLAEVRQLSEHDAQASLFARMSYNASLQAELLAYRLSNRLGLGETMKLAFSFCLLWFLANWTYQLGLSNTEVGVVNVLSSSSSLFTLILASIFPSIDADKFSLSKFLAVLLSFSGVAIVSLSDLNVERKSALPIGSLFALLSALFYASYLVFLRKRVDHEDKLNFPMFFGFVGLFNLLLLWPMFFALNYSGIESFDLPSKRQWLFLIVNGVIGTVFSEILWLWGCFLTSSLIATLAISLTIPMSMIVDIILKGISYSGLFYLGATPMLISFFSVTLFTHYEWDPAMEGLKKMRRFFRKHSRREQSLRINVETADEDESLIEDEGEEETEDRGYDSIDSPIANNIVNSNGNNSSIS